VTEPLPVVGEGSLPASSGAQSTMHVLQHLLSGPETCQYLPDRQATQEYVRVAEIAPPEYEALMDRGWRKFGSMLFRPVCSACDECRPIRIPIQSFVPDRGQRRAWARNADLSVRYESPSFSDARLNLYRRYQAAQTELKDWPGGERTARGYKSQFLQNPLPAVEISVWEGDVLRAVALADVTPNVVSGVYHFHDPDCRERGLGTLVMLHTIELARRLGKTWAYFGFYVAGCPSMAYKARFRPCEILGPDGVWRGHSPITDSAPTGV